MEETSILNSTKKILGMTKDFKDFDLDVMTQINTVIAILHQVGVGPVPVLFIEDDSIEWDEFLPEGYLLSLVRTYVFLKVQMYFDPPNTSFLIEAKNKQIEELEQRISMAREWDRNPVDPLTLVEVTDEY